MKSKFSSRIKAHFGKPAFEGKIVIVGAGAAGIFAGFLLQELDVEFEILEASDCVGGRLKVNRNFADFPLDLGAEWLHGSNSIAKDFVDETGTKIIPENEKFRYWFQGKLHRKFEHPDLNFIDAVLEGETPFDGPDLTVLEYINQKKIPSDIIPFLQSICATLGTSIDRLSMLQAQREFEHCNYGNDDFKFKKSYYDFVEKNFVQPIKNKIKLGTIVKAIDYSFDGVRIFDSHYNLITCDKVLLTVPVPVLKDNDIYFYPFLPKEKQLAIQKIGMDKGMKVFLKFKKPFYKKSIVGTTVASSYYEGNFGKDSDMHILVGYIMGKPAEILGNNEEEIVAKLLDELDSIFKGKASKFFIDAFVQNWGAEPFIRGAYSYSTKHIGNSRAVLAKSIDNKIYFAGEASHYEGHFQTVQGAMETGWREVMKMLSESSVTKKEIT